MRCAELDGFSQYFVTDEGNIYGRRYGKPLIGGISNAGYKKIVLVADDGSRKTMALHRVIASVFCKREEGQDEVNHINGNKLDNRAENLEWVSRKDNLRHAFETGLMPNNTTPKAVVATNMETGEQMVFSSIFKAAKYLGISQGNICMCCKDERPFANGYYWDYLQEGE